MSVNLTPTSIAERVILLESWRAALLAIAAGAISALALAPYHLFPVLLLTFPVFVWLLDGAVAPASGGGVVDSWKRFWPAFKIGWLFGFGYFLLGMWWIGKAFLVDAGEFIYFLPFAVLALPAGLALFWGVAAALTRLAWGDGWVRLVTLAACLTLAEWLRGTVLTGLPWNTLGYAFMPTPVFMQSASLIGVYGVTFFAVFIAASPGIFAPGEPEGPNRRPRRMRRVLLVACLLFAAHAGFGAYRLGIAHSDFQPNIRLRLVQPAINQSEKWDPANEAEIMRRYLSLSNTNKGPEAASIASFTHVIWPESAFPFILTQRRDQLAAIASLLPPTTTLITGAMRLEPGTPGVRKRQIFNALYVINDQGIIVEARDKTRLVPFGEFLPFQSVLENLGISQLTQLQGGFATGGRRRTVALDRVPPFLPLICYEIIYSGAIVPSLVDSVRPEWIVNLTNDAWFGLTAGPYQHAHQAQVRAVEEGLPVARAANNGISMVIDGYGRVRSSLALGVRGVVDSALPKAAPTPLFAKSGNIPMLIFICILLLVLVAISRVNKSKLQ